MFAFIYYRYLIFAESLVSFFTIIGLRGFGLVSFWLESKVSNLEYEKVKILQFF